MFCDIIQSYHPIRYIDIHAYENTEDYLSNYRALTYQENVSVDVRIAHDLMSNWKMQIIDTEQDKKKKRKKKSKREKVMIHKKIKAHDSRITAESISLGVGK